MLDEALSYAARGWAVIPLHTPSQGGGCSCRKADCESIGKHPRTRNGLHDASSDPDQIRRWWGYWSDANIGIVCGASGLVVVDIDPRHGGDDSYADLVRKHGRELTDTVAAVSGGGGEHFWFASPVGEKIPSVTSSERFVGALGVGVDVRATGGYIVAPPSLHASGNRYEWQPGYSPLDMEPAALPPALHDLLTAGRLRLEVQPLIMADVLAGLPDGGRDEGLFRASAKLRYADVPFDMARDLILRAAAACDPPFPPSQAEKCVLSAYRRFEPSGAHIIDDQIEGFDRVLLDDLVANDPEPTNWLIQDVLVRGQTHLVFGEPESGKTILAIRWMLDAVAAGETVVFVDEESGARSVADKLRAMRAGAVDQGLHYFPFPSLDATKSATFQDTLDGLQPALVVFDSMTDLLAASGLDENSGVEVTGWFKSVAEPLSRRPYSPAVVIIDHVSKDTLNTRYSVGSRAKKAKSDVMWLVQRDGAFDRVTTSDVELIRQKNRPGTLPQTVKYVVGGRDGVLVAERYDPLVHGVETWPGRTRQIFEYIASQDGFATTSAIRAVCDDVKRQSLDPYFDWLTGQGLVTLETNGRASGYRLTEKGFSTVSLTQPLRQPDAAFATGDLRQVTPPIRGVPVAKPNGVETEEKKGLRHWWID